MPEIDKVNVDGVEYDIANKVSSVNSKTGAVTLTASDVGAYVKPSGGIPKTDLASAVQTSLGKADSAYQKPSGGIPKTDLASAVQTSLGKADSALQSAPVTSVDGKTGAVTILPSGGSQGQVLKKSSNTDYAVVWANESGGGGGTSDYTDLTNKPSINSVTLSGNKTAADLGLAPGWSVEADTNTGAVTKSLSERVSCLFTGALTSLTITLGGEASGHYHFDFSTGSTAPTLTLPSTVLTPDGFTVEANKAYEVDILNKHAAIQSWSLS